MSNDEEGFELNVQDVDTAAVELGAYCCWKEGELKVTRAL